MLYRQVPKNQDKLSILGFGAMRLPGNMGNIDREKATKQIYSAIDQGVNYIDTAYPYHGGKSEPFLGSILSKNGYRNKVKLATKLPHWATKNKEEMDKILDEQLEKLQTDHIDYYLIHALDGPAWQKCKEKGVIEFLDGALASGKIINAGFSYHGSTEDFNTIVDEYDWTFCQIQYNYLDTNYQAGRAGLEYAASKNLAIIIMEPLRGGNLAKNPPKEIQAIWDKSENKRTAVDWALRWIWNHPEVTSIISGMNHDDHVTENIKIASDSYSGSLSDYDLKIVEQASEKFRTIMKSACTGCQYCMPCPHGVNIPICLNTYNSYHAFKDKSAKFMYLLQNGGVTGKPALASQCTSCNICLEKCPQNLPIPTLLKDVKNEFEGILTKPLIWIMKKFMKVKK